MKVDFALSSLDIPQYVIPALSLLINELYKLDINLSVTPRPTFGGRSRMQWPDGFRPAMSEKILDFGVDFFGSRSQIPVEVFCTLMGGVHIFSICGFDVEYQRRRMENSGYSSPDLSSLQTVNRAIRLAKKSDILPTTLKKKPFKKLSKAEQFVFLLNKLDDLYDFEDIVENFPEMIKQPHTRRLYSHSIAPINRLSLGATKLEQQMVALLATIVTGYDKYAPKATIIKFSPQTLKN